MHSIAFLSQLSFISIILASKRIKSTGFYNSAKGFFGKPSYKDVAFQLNSAEKQITIKLD
jgi:hypothetical protein